MAQPGARKLRLLCLHGMYQNADTFAAKTKHLRALTRSTNATDAANVEYIYLDGPFTVTPRVLAKQNQHSHSSSSSATTATRSPRHRPRSEQLFRAWWRPSGPHQAAPTQLEQDREQLLTSLRTQLAALDYDVDGVLGFSQGASLASWLCTAQARLELRWRPRVAVLIGSYAGPQQYSLASGILPATHSLHLYGVNDHVVAAAKSEAVVDAFRQAQDDPMTHVVTTIHGQGHVVPKCDAALAQFRAFVDQHAAHRTDSNGTTPTSNSNSNSSESHPLVDATKRWL